MESKLEIQFAPQTGPVKRTSNLSYRQPAKLRLDEIRVSMDELFLREATQKQVSLQPTDWQAEQRKLLQELQEQERLRGESLECQANGILLPDPAMLKERLACWAKAFGLGLEGDLNLDAMYDGLEEFLQDYLSNATEVSGPWKGFPTVYF